MLLVFHIILAITSLGFSLLLTITPSQIKLRVTYILTAITLISGTILSIQRHIPITKACLTEMAFLGVVLITVVIGKRRLATLPESN